MENNRILRSPDVSVKTVTINSAYETVDISSDSSETESAKLNNDLQYQAVDDSGVNVANVVEAKKELERSELEAFSARLEEKEKLLLKNEDDIKEQMSAFEHEKNNYRESISEDLRQEITGQVQSEYKEKVTQINQLIESLAEKMTASIDGAEDEMVAIVYESVCKVIGKQMKESSSVISVVKEVMKFTQDRMEMTLRVSEKDYEILKDVKDELSVGVSNRIEVIADEHVRYGGCILETKAGRIDGRLEQQLNSLMQLMLNGRG